MALTRNQRRKAAREKQLAKAVRISNAAETVARNERNAIVASNLSKPRERNYYASVRSCLDGIAGKSHRGYVCQNLSRPKFHGSIDDRGVMR